MQCCSGFRYSIAILLLAGGAVYSWPAAKHGDGATREFKVVKGRAYGLLASVPKLSILGKDERVDVTVTDPSGAKLSKSLHAGDADLYLTLLPQESGALAVQAPAGVEVSLEPLGGAENKFAQFGSAMHNTWQAAEPIELGRPVYASSDDRPYIPRISSPKEKFDQMLAGVHWYKAEYRGPGDRLVHFNLEILDRDVPLDVAVFTLEEGKPVEYTRGRERYETEKSTNFHGLAKFAPRVLSPGTYYVRVMGNHPYYKLESEMYPAPPYQDPRQAVRTAMDYIVRRGDSWHANVPRKGAVVLRDSNPLQETRLCIACHPTQFSTRGELFAIENGYPVRARASLQYLTERIYNNPRPIYGKTDASWARMIHAPGNVLSRVAYLANKYDTLITGERREELYRGVSQYLEMYWPGVNEPSPESNGNLPRISGYEVAMHNGMLFEDLYRRHHAEKHKALREQIERVILSGKTADVLDMCWKLDALVWLGKEKYTKEIEALVAEIFQHQQQDGRWAMPLGMEEIQYNFQTQRTIVKKLPKLAGQEGPRASDFQTWHAIYALARAGVTMDDARLKKAVELCLSRQTPSGAWQGNPDYKNFDTPFRDTQYALMALSTLFPGPKGRGGANGWNAGFPAPPASFNEKDPLSTVAALDQHWDRPDAPTVAKIRKLLDSPHVMVRYQAAVALGRFGDGASLAALSPRLGDSSKLVQRAAAWSLRQIASRRPEAREQAIRVIQAALDSPAERTRWGATRIFNQHFKYLSEEWTLGDRLRRIADSDSVPAVKMAATQALYQWWYWDRNLDHKSAIEDTLIAGLGREEHPMVRRNFIEAYYNVLDDNVRYLYGSWIPRVKQAEDKKAIENGHHGSVRIQAQRYRDAMVNGNALTRDGLLRALYTHHVREGLPDVSALANAAPPPTVAGHFVNGYKFQAMYDPVTGGSAGFTSIGNDAEPPVFYADSAPLMNEAFLAALDGASPATVTSAMRALTFLKTLKIGQPLAERILSLVTEAPAAAEVAKTQLKNHQFAPARLDAMVASGGAPVLEVLAALKSKPTAEAVRQRLLKTPAEDRTFPAVVALAGGLSTDAAVTGHILKGLDSKRPLPQQAALRFALAHPDAVTLPAGFPESYGPYAIGGALSVLSLTDSPPVPVARKIVLAGLNNSVHTIRTQALKTLLIVEALHKDEEIRRRAAALKRDPENEVRRAAMSFESAQALRAGGRPGDVLDYFYFKENVEPILLTKASDSHACANCHANHTLLKLQEPDEYGVITLAKSTINFREVSKMVNVKDPESSLLLNKPISPLDDAGIGDSQAFSHGGGLRWAQRKDSREYKTVLRWIQGARIESGGGN